MLKNTWDSKGTKYTEETENFAEEKYRKKSYFFMTLKGIFMGLKTLGLITLCHC